MASWCKRAPGGSLVTDGEPMKSDHPEADCPMIVLLDRIADKWAVLVMAMLRHDAMRFNELRRCVGGISQKMLAQTLRGLERDGLVTRTVFATSPVTVEYAITTLGMTLVSTMDELRIWSEKNINAVSAARRRFDAARQDIAPVRMRG